MAAPTRDHIHPRHRGGTLAPHNKALACVRCNGDKGGRSLGSWLYALDAAGDRRAVSVAAILAGLRPKKDSTRPLRAYIG